MFIFFIFILKQLENPAHPRYLQIVLLITFEKLRKLTHYLSKYFIFGCIVFVLLLSVCFAERNKLNKYENCILP